MNEQYHPIRTWIRNIIRFELFYRLFIILIVYPLSNWLINLYITTNTVHSSLSNFSMFFDFLSIPGILVMAVILGSAICIIVFPHPRARISQKTKASPSGEVGGALGGGWDGFPFSLLVSLFCIFPDKHYLCTNFEST